VLRLRAALGMANHFWQARVSLVHKEKRGPGSKAGAPSPGPGARYDAFISYSHGADSALAPALRDGIQRLGKPWYRRRAARVFLDETSMAANPGLWTGITEILERTDHLILLASPEAAASEWVEREVAWWGEHKPPNRLLIALTAGEVRWKGTDFDWERTTALPKTLSGAFAEEPLYVDLRWARTAGRMSVDDPRFHDDVADLSAFVTGRSKDDLLGEDLRQHRRALRQAWTAVALLLALLAASVGLGVAARSQRNEARAQARLALSRQLAAQSTSLGADRLDLSLLLAIEAVATLTTPETQDALLASLSQNPQLVYSRPIPEATAGLAYDGERGRLAWGTKHGVTLWDVAARTLQHLDGLADVTHVATSRAGIVAARGEGGVMLWDPTQPQAAGAALPGVTEWVQFNAEGTTLAAIGKAPGAVATVTLFDIASRQRRGETTVLTYPPRAPPPTVSLCRGRKVCRASPDLRLLACTLGHRLTFWNLGGRRAQAGPTLMGNDDEVFWDIAFSPDGKTLASVSGKDSRFCYGRGRIQLWDMERFGPKAEPLVGLSGFRDVAFSADGGLVAATTGPWDAKPNEESEVVLVDGSTGASVGSPLRVPGSRPGWGLQVAFGPHHRLATLTDTHTATLTDNSVAIWAVGRSDRLATPISTFTNRDSWAQDVVYSPDGRLVAVAVTKENRKGTRKQKVFLWDVKSGRRIGAPFRGGDAVVFSHDGARLAVVETTQQVTIRDVANHTVVGEPFAGASAAFSPDSQTLAVGKDDGTILLWDLRANREANVLAARTDRPANRSAQSWSLAVKWLAFGPGIGTLSSGRRDGLVTRWSLAGEPHVTSELWTEPEIPEISSIAFSPDGRFAAVSTSVFEESTIGRLSVWDVAKEAQLFGQEWAVNDVAFSHDGRRFVTVDPWGSVLLWDTAGMRSHKIPVLRGGTYAVDVGSDGSLAVATTEGAWISSIDTASWIEAACQVFGRSLTQTEWNEYIGTARPFVERCGPGANGGQPFHPIDPPRSSSTAADPAP
jgi:WD40 repeat protein